MSTDKLGPELASFDDPISGVVTVHSYHYDVLARLRKIRLQPETGADFWLVPVFLLDGTLGLERREVGV